MIRFLCVAVFLLLPGVPDAFGAVWYVDQGNVSGTEDGTTPGTAFVTIQEGINAASAGDIVEVSPGTYAEAIDFGDLDIVVRSTDPTDADVRAATIIAYAGGRRERHVSGERVGVGGVGGVHDTGSE